MASSPDSRGSFISSTIQVAREFGFDGVDLDWEYPQIQTDMDNFGLLLDEWRVAVNEEAQSNGNSKLLLSAATYYKPVIPWDVVHTYPDPTVDGIGAPAVGLGPGNDGAMLYTEVLEFNAENNAKVVFDESTVYDDVESVKLKIEFAQSLSIGGYFFWTVVGDQEWRISQLGRHSILSFCTLV
ncbi:hypothetical protein L1987_29865 [Smallanthus sonchifolius]|uniref:Uncharacterized protein n=1 Tax=Smallanthus sonchifolius TaxID=185202 RepID=A0ACB9I2H2_9ASTR|nr:hypothetical protein L1987_29865 [Smallanthus sonchifolius]